MPVTPKMLAMMISWPASAIRPHGAYAAPCVASPTQKHHSKK
jgi:hypothetical protein